MAESSSSNGVGVGVNVGDAVLLETPGAAAGDMNNNVVAGNGNFGGGCEKSACSSAGSSAATSTTERVSNNSHCKEHQLQEGDPSPASAVGGGANHQHQHQLQQLPEATKQPVLLETIDPTTAKMGNGGSGVPLVVPPRQKSVVPKDGSGKNGKNSPRSTIRKSTNSNSPSPPSDQMTSGHKMATSAAVPSSVSSSSAGRTRHARTQSDEIPRTIHGGYGIQQHHHQQQQMQSYHHQQQQMQMMYPYQHQHQQYPAGGSSMQQQHYQGYYQTQQQQQQPSGDPRLFSSYNQYQRGSYSGAGGMSPQLARAKSDRYYAYPDGHHHQQQQQIQQTHSFGGGSSSGGGGGSGYPAVPSSPSTRGIEKDAGSTRSTMPHANSERMYHHRPYHRRTGSGTAGGRRRSRHQKSHSYNAALPSAQGGGPAGGYGSFWSSEGMPPPPPAGGGDGLDDPNFVPQSPRFDRRSEIWNLTSSLRNSPRSTPHSPQQQQGPTGPLMPLHESSNYNTIITSSTPDLRVSFSPSTPSGRKTFMEKNVNSIGSSSSAGEALFVAQKRHKPESSRRKHIRQHSAQLFMEDIKGIPQPPACRDILFLLLFVFHLFFIVLLGNLYAGEALKKSSTSIGTAVAVETDDSLAVVPEYESGTAPAAGTVTVYYENLLFLSVVSGAFAIGVSTVMLAIMSMFARKFVQVALMLIIVLSFGWGTAGIGLSPRNVVPITGIIALALSVAYAFIVWDRIPFAAANLVTALTAIRQHPGTVLVALVFQILCLGWSIYYCIVVIGVFDAIGEGKLAVSHQVEVLIYVLLGISFYWTYQVMLNTVQAITAAVVGKWWIDPEETGVVRHAAFGTIFYSMGSICFGSLFVGPVRVVRQIAVIFRPTSDEASLLCLHECLHCIQSCITNVVDSLAVHFNSWAFAYIGMYRYGFTAAGRHASELFEKRGWTKIATDDLVPNVLLMTSLVLGGVTGTFAFAMQKLDQFQILSLGQPSMVSFWLGFVNGLVLTSVLFGVISSSVSTVLVCFAGSPVDFDTNHPNLSDEMRNAWREVWPGALDVVDLRVALASPTHGDGLGPLFQPPPPPPPLPPLPVNPV